MTLPQLVRVRWGVRTALAVGIAASVAANILHARENTISQVISAWPPLALLVTVELISRVPVASRRLSAVRLIATTLIAGIAAWVSYWHMAGVAGRYGETGASPYLLPLSVDGLVIVASVSLVELAGRIRDVAAVPDPVKKTAPARPRPTTTSAGERTPVKKATKKAPARKRATPTPPAPAVPVPAPALPVAQRLTFERGAGVELLPAGRPSS